MRRRAERHRIRIPPMFYTCILRSLLHPDQRYIGSTSDLKSRLAKHNAAKYHIPQSSVRGKQKPILLLKPKKKLSHLKLISKQAPVMHSPSVISEFLMQVILMTHSEFPVEITSGTAAPAAVITSRAATGEMIIFHTAKRGKSR